MSPGKSISGLFQSDDIDISYSKKFKIHRSGIYYLSCYADLQDPLTSFISIRLITNHNKTYSSRMESSSGARQIHMNQLVLFDKSETFSVSIFTEEPGKLTTSTRIILHFITSYTYVLGFIARPRKTKTLQLPALQVLVNWNPFFETTHGFASGSGDYTSLKDGYYLVIIQFTLSNVFGKIHFVLISQDGVNHVIKRELFETISKTETLTYAGIHRIKEKEKLFFRIVTENCQATVHPDSTYSVVLIEALLPNQDNKKIADYRHSVLTKSEVIPPKNIGNLEKGTQIKEWKTFNNNTAFMIKGAFQIRESGYYFVHAQVRFQSSPNPNLVHAQIRIEKKYIYRMTKQNSMGDLSSFFGVFYFKKMQAISCYIENESPHHITVNSRLTNLMIYELKFQTYSILYTLHQPQPTNNQNFLPLNQQATANFDIITSNDGSIVRILKRGIYSVVLNHFTNNQAIHATELSIISRSSVQDPWYVVSKCIDAKTGECFLPLVLEFKKGQVIAVTSSKNLSSKITSSILNIIFLKEANKQKKYFSTYLKLDKSKEFALPTDHLKEPLGGGMTVQRNGFYLLTCNLLIKNITGKITVFIKYTRRKRSKSIKKITRTIFSNTSAVQIAFSEGFYLNHNDELQILIQHNNQQIHLSESLFSFILMTTENARYRWMKAVSHSPMTGVQTVNFRNIRPKKGKLDETYFSSSVVMCQRSSSSLTMITLIGKAICSNDLSHDIQASVDLGQWHFKASRSRIKCGESITLYMTGILIAHEGDFLKVYVKTSGEMKFSVSSYTTLTLFVLKNEMPLVLSSSLYVTKEIIDITTGFKTGKNCNLQLQKVKRINSRLCLETIVFAILSNYF